MSIQEQITRIETAKGKIRTKLVDFGLVENTANIDALAEAVEGIVNRGTADAEIKEGASYTIEKGYYAGGTIKAITDTEGEAELYKTQTKTVTPTKELQNIGPDTGYYALSSVAVNPIPQAYQDVSSVDAAAANVLTGKKFVNKDGTLVTGTMKNNGAVTKTLDTATTSYTVPAGYHDGKGTVSVVTETKEATPSETQQTISATSGKVLKTVTVKAIPSTYVGSGIATKSGDVAITPAYNSTSGKAEASISDGYYTNTTLQFNAGTPTSTTHALTIPTTADPLYVSVPEGYYKSGTVTLDISNKKSTTLSKINGDTVTSVTLDAGYYDGNIIEFDGSAIETKLAAI